MTTFDIHSLFGLSNVAVAPSPALSGNILTVSTGDGSLFSINQNIVLWPSGGFAPTKSTAEVARITGISGDQLTITRAQEGSSAKSIQVGWQIANAVTPKIWTDLETAVTNRPFVTIGLTGTGADVTYNGLNDTSQLNSLIDTLNGLGGATIHIKSPFNLKNDGIHMLSNIILEAEGEATPLTMVDAASYNPITSGSFISPSASNYNILRDLTINGNRSIVPGANSLLWIASTRVIFERLRIHDMTGVGILLRQCTFSRARYCDFDYCMANAISIYDNSHYCKIDHCTDQHQGGAYSFEFLGSENAGQQDSSFLRAVDCQAIGTVNGFSMRAGVNDSKFIGCDVNGATGYAFEIAGEDVINDITHHCQDDQVLGCTAVDAVSDGFRAESYGTSARVYRAHFTDNIAHGCATGLRIGSKANNCATRGNYLTNNTTPRVDSGSATNLGDDIIT